MQTNSFDNFVDGELLRRLFELEKEQDLGKANRDVTSSLLIDADEKLTAAFVSRERGYICGLAAIPYLVETYDKNLVFEPLVADGDLVEAGTEIAKLSFR